MLIGETRAGKSSLIRALSGEEFHSHRAMAVEYFGDFINTPGEFLENSRYYHALITSSADCDTLIMVQDATRNTSLFPPLFAPIFNRPVVGVISKMDAPNANAERAELFLRNAGARTIVPTSAKDGTGIDVLRDMLD
ncbi:EutP/PduV family microcompartment system protein [Pseudodesulfovibrio sp. zrk46]|uniref:EutP/PduV family microcompartment system protein n=1 Tax=Pseudodesulfovibrio sp. zrk46 TaxID=2725288 RepID=UPI001FFC44E8|nr:EutP/PduV family microcompartment system protein [Pseudodesulfovibrio sp. zrk46]